MKKWLLYTGLLCFIGIPLRTLAQAPAPPTNLTASLVPAEDRMAVELKWDYALTGGEGTHLFFKIHRSTDDDMHFEPLAVTGDTSFIDIHVPSGHTYFYFVTALMYSGSEGSTIISESGPSDTVSVSVTSPPAPPRGTIAGMVTDSVTGKPIPFVRVEFFRKLDGWEHVRYVWTDTSGKYSALLDTGTYLIRAVPLCFWPMALTPISIYMRYRPEWFDDAFEIANATPVSVTDKSLFTADFDLQRVVPPMMAKVQGTVTDTSGNPLAHALVVFFRPFAEMPRLDSMEVHPLGADNDDVDIDDIGRLGGVWKKVWTDSLGKYTEMLESGRSYIAMAVRAGYLPQFFNHESDPRNADVIHLAGDTTGIDFSLTARPVATASISGTVRDSSGTGVASRIILIPVPLRRGVRFGSTDSAGLYQISHVWDGKYFVLAIPIHGYAPAFYKAGAYGVIQWQLADTVSISGAVTGIDVGVVRATGDGAGTISGMITADGVPVAGVNIYAMDGGGALIGFAISDNKGAYAIDGITAGQFSVVATRDGFNTEQNTVSVGQGTFAVGGVNFAMMAAGTSSVNTPPGLPGDYALDQNYPNPFNPGTTISFAIPSASTVRLTIYNVLGQEIATLKNGVMPAGRFDAQWSGRDDAGRTVSSGVYFYKLDAAPVGGGNTFSSIRKMVLLK